MMKHLTAVITLLALVTWGTVALAQPKDVVELKGGVMGKISFPHKEHQGRTECMVCHHGQEAGKEEACTKCHTRESAKTNKDAFHTRCQGCHKDGGKGPVKCTECHKK